MNGADNMAFDLDTLRRVASANVAPLLRFFRWDKPTVSYGKHQSLEKIQTLIPSGWKSVQRPTGGGLVFHQNDLCLSLCWRSGQSPLPTRLKDHYAWIHAVMRDALKPMADTRLADCMDCSAPSHFDTRDCFTEPVAYDVLQGRQKIAGGALCRKNNAFLYQGSVQGITLSSLEKLLHAAFTRALQTP